MKITQIQQAKKNIDRVNIFVDEEFWVSITKRELIEFGLFKNQELDNNLKAQVEEGSKSGKVEEKVMKWLNIRPRSVKETLEYLKFKQRLEKQDAQRHIDKLVKLGLLDDEKFAQWYVKNRIEFGLHSPRKISAELFKKGISAGVSSRILKQAYSEEKILGNIDKFIQKRSLRSSESIKKYLLNRGFSYNIASKFGEK